MRPPRITAETRAALQNAIVAAGSAEAADKVIDRLFSLLEGDMQDRINGLINAAQAVLEAKPASSAMDAAVKGLRRAHGFLAGREVAATSTKQIKEGDCNFDRQEL